MAPLAVGHWLDLSLGRHVLCASMPSENTPGTVRRGLTRMPLGVDAPNVRILGRLEDVCSGEMY